MGGTAVAGREGKRARTVARPEQPGPAERLECLGEKQQHAPGDKQPWVSARERPAGGSEMTEGEQRERERKEAVAEADARAAPPRAAKARKRPKQQAVTALDYDRRSDRGKRHHWLGESGRFIRRSYGVRTEAGRNPLHRPVT